METYNQSVCNNCLMQGCRGHNCDAEDREVHEAIPDVMAVLHGNLELQQGLLDAAADTTSAAVVAPLTFGTYFSLVGIDDHEVDSRQISHRHQDITFYFSDEDDNSSPSGGEEVGQEMRNDEDQGSEEDEPPLDSFSYHRPLTQGSSGVTKKWGIANRLQVKLAVMSSLTGSTQAAISSGPFTIPPKNLP
jgi:hypothetical protein